MPAPGSGGRVRLRSLQFLRLAGRPADDDAVDGGAGAEAEVEPALVLRAEARSARDFLHLLPSVPEHLDLRADRAPVAARLCRRVVAAAALQIEGDPLAIRRDLVLVEQQRSALVGDDHVERAAAAEVGERDRAAVVAIGDADHLRDVDEAARPVVDPDPLRLVAGQAARAHGGPVGGVADDRCGGRRRPWSSRTNSSRCGQPRRSR